MAVTERVTLHVMTLMVAIHAPVSMVLKEMEHLAEVPTTALL